MALFGAILPIAIHLAVQIYLVPKDYFLPIKFVFILDLASSILFTVISCLSAISAWAECSQGYTGYNYSPLIEMEFMVAAILT